jgi:hypothetical protein
MLRATGWTLVVALLLAAWTEAAAAQSDGPPTAAAQSGEAPSPRTLLSVLAGVQGTNPEIHAFAGVGGGYLVRPRAGAEGVALLGAGRGYRSGLIGGGPSLVVLDEPRVQLRLWGGPAWYRESLAPSEIAGDATRAGRATGAAMAGLTVRAPVGRVALTGGLLYWTGRFEEAGFQRSENFHGFRLTVGVAR